MFILRTLLVMMLMLSVSAFAQVTAVPQWMHFQGRLANPDGTPVPDGTHSVRFSLWTAASGGTEKWNQTVSVAVRNGTFAAPLDTSTGAADKFNNSLFLEIKIGTNPPLTPRQPLTSVAYAMKADKVKDGAITGASIANGTITADKLAPNAIHSLAWLLGGNAGTNPATQFVGTTDNTPLHFRANNLAALRLEFSQADGNMGNNVIGGYWNNAIPQGTFGATVFGGGRFGSTGEYPNRVTDNFATVLGGIANRAGNDNADLRDANGAAVVGGFSNIASNSYSFVGAGYQNTASGFQSVVAGGINNVASGASSMVPGGGGNVAAGQASFAAGSSAKALHAGSFVWSDSLGITTTSTAANQFLIRAQGGVGINTTNPGGYTFTVNGSIRANSLVVGGSQTTTGSLAVGGTLTIGNVPFGDYRNMQINGNTGQVYYDNSSRKHKRNITPLVDDFEKLLQAVPMTYTRPAAPNRWEIGFIAEDFDALGLKRLVDYSDQGEVEGINYEKICLYLTAIARKQKDGLQEQQKQIEMLRKQKDAEVTEQKVKNAELEARLERIEAALRNQK